jgi:hypothetical protein
MPPSQKNSKNKNNTRCHDIRGRFISNKEAEDIVRNPIERESESMISDKPVTPIPGRVPDP